MPAYCVNTRAQSNGDHEVHNYGCNYLPDQQNRQYLGDFATCHGAVAEAKKSYRQSNGCYFCSMSCHTT
jgi:hypothetical protein